jgi:hypothetical protein
MVAMRSVRVILFMGKERASAKAWFLGSSRSLSGEKCKNYLGFKVDNGKCFLDTENDGKNHN